MANLLTSLLVGFWIVAIALISVQNFTPVTLRFLQFQSVQIPLGIVVAFSAALGVVGTAVLLPLLSGSKPRRRMIDDDF